MRSPTLSISATKPVIQPQERLTFSATAARLRRDAAQFSIAASTAATRLSQAWPSPSEAAANAHASRASPATDPSRPARSALILSTAETKTWRVSESWAACSPIKPSTCPLSAPFRRSSAARSRPARTCSMRCRALSWTCNATTSPAIPSATLRYSCRAPSAAAATRSRSARRPSSSAAQPCSRTARSARCSLSSRAADPLASSSAPRRPAAASKIAPAFSPTAPANSATSAARASNPAASAPSRALSTRVATASTRNALTELFKSLSGAQRARSP